MKVFAHVTLGTSRTLDFSLASNGHCSDFAKNSATAEASILSFRQTQTVPGTEWVRQQSV